MPIRDKSCSRNFMRLTLPIISMVITFNCSAEIFSRAVEVGNFCVSKISLKINDLGYKNYSCHSHSIAAKGLPETHHAPN